jgi:hypothetical protein
VDRAEEKEEPAKPNKRRRVAAADVGWRQATYSFERAAEAGRFWRYHWIKRSSMMAETMMMMMMAARKLLWLPPVEYSNIKYQYEE